MKFTALKHFLCDLIAAAFRPPYSVVDHQSYGGCSSYYSLRKAIASADSDPTRRTKTGTVHAVGIGNRVFYFSIDGRGRKHLPQSLRKRIL